MPKEISAGAIIFRKNTSRKYLLLHYEASHWDFPKGNIEKGEKTETTVRREVKEETGIEGITFIPGFKQRINYFYKRDKKTIYKEVIHLLAETKTNTVKLSNEHTGFTWLDYKKAYELVTFRSSKEILKKADSYLSTLQQGCDSIESINWTSLLRLVLSKHHVLSI
ncbi:MAG: bis(5'-nucleosyl)-tetraphosphatase [Thermoproteota archaeon]